MKLTFNLYHQEITRLDHNTVVADSRNYLTAKFIPLTNDWIAPITAIFGDYTVVLDDNLECIIPWEVLTEKGVFEVSAFCGDLHTANVCGVYVEESGYKEGVTPQPPTPDVYATLTEKVTNAEAVAQSVRDDADAGLFKGEKGDPGIQGEPGAKGEPGLTQTEHDALINATAAAITAKENVEATERTVSANETQRIANEDARETAVQTAVDNANSAASTAETFARNQLRNTVKNTLVHVEDAFAPNKPDMIKVFGKTVVSEDGLTCVENVALNTSGVDVTQATTTPIDLQGHKLCSLPDGTADEFASDRNETWINKKLALEDIVSITEFGTHSSGVPYVAIKPEKNVYKGYDYKKIYATGYEWDIFSKDNKKVYSPRPDMIVFNDTRFTSKDIALEILQREVKQVLYLMENPERIDLTPVPLPDIPSMTANVWTDSNMPEVETEVAYVQDVNKVISDITSQIAKTQNLAL